MSKFEVGLNLRMTKRMHEVLAAKAAEEEKSITQWIRDAINEKASREDGLYKRPAIIVGPEGRIETRGDAA